MLNIATKPLFRIAQPLFWILGKVIDSKLADRILRKLDEK
jgi:hypothetical protein